MKPLMFALLLAMGAMIVAVPTAEAKTAQQVQQEEANRKLVLSIFESNDPEMIIGLMADDYKQHNPAVADGKAGAAVFFRDMFKKFPNSKAQVYRSAADGDLVWVHAHLVMDPKDPGIALVDIFRVKDGKLVEHWDIMQPVPAAAANSHSMF